MEELKTLLNLILIAAIPVCAAFFVRFLHRKTAQVQAQTESDALKDLLEEVSHAVSVAVAYTSQTVVDNLKASGEFNAAAQAQEFKQSFEIAMMILTPAAIELIKKHYGNIKSFIEPLIEAEVRKQKQPQALELIDQLDIAEGIAADEIDEIAEGLSAKLSEVFSRMATSHETADNAAAESA